MIYEKGLCVKRDILKAINYYEKCSINKSSKFVLLSNNDEESIYEEKILYNQYYYQSNNDLGLIYITEKEHINREMAEKYLNEAGLNEYPPGQNNLALFNQFYLKKIDKSIYLFEKVSKKHFSLSEFNLGYLYEIDNKTKESLEHYIKASEYESEPIVFRNRIIYDERLDISKTFIICYSNLKLSHYYSKQQKLQVKSNEKLSHEYFMKAMFHHLFSLIFHLKKYSYTFNFKTEKNKESYIITNLRDFILKNPLFHYWDENMPIQQNDELFGWTVSEPKTKNNFVLNLVININEINENADIKESYSIIEKKELLFSQYDENTYSQNDDEIKSHFEFMNKRDEFEIIKDEDCGENINVSNTNNDNNSEILKIKMKGNDIKWFFKYHKKLKNILLNTLKENQKEIIDILNEMKTILYTEPYSILFGRINIYSEEKIKDNKDETQIINDDFYEGLNDGGNI